MNILQIDSSVLGDNSVSRSLTASVVADLVAATPDAKVTVRDLDQDAPAHLSGNLLPVLGGPKEGLSAIQEAELQRTEQWLAEFLAADVLVVGVPQYNFSIPSQLKAWIDRIAVSGKTFRYTENGPEGLAKGKKIIVASTRGGHYSAGPAAVMDHQESYLKTVFGFLGVTDVEFVRAEGLNLSADSKQFAIAEAEKTIAEGNVLRLAS